MYSTPLYPTHMNRRTVTVVLILAALAFLLSAALPVSGALAGLRYYCPGAEPWIGNITLDIDDFAPFAACARFPVILSGSPTIGEPFP